MQSAFERLLLVFSELFWPLLSRAATSRRQVRTMDNWKLRVEDDVPCVHTLTTSRRVDESRKRVCCSVARAIEILEAVMFRSIFEAIHPAMDVNARQSWRPVRRVGLLVSLLALSLFEHQTEVANAASFRVDDATLTVPALLTDDWRAVKARSSWTRATGDAIPGDPKFVRFLAREYSFQLSAGSLRLKTTWFAARKCVSTDEAVRSLRGSKRAAIETAFGSLDDMNRRLQGKTSDGTEGRIVIWAQFRSKPDKSLPIDALSVEDQEILSPFAELAKQSFDTRIFNSSNCSKNEDPSEARKAARSGGRRMPASRSGTRSGSRMKSSKGAPLPTGTMTSGGIPQGMGSSLSGTGRGLRDGGENSRADKQLWGFLISQYVSEPGSLTFNLVGRFTRCIRARAQNEALAGMRARYRPVVAAAGGRRTSYTVVVTDTAGCQDTQHNQTAGEYVPGNFNNPGGNDSNETGGTGGEAGGTGGTGLPDGNDPLVPSPDPLNGDPSSGGDSGGMERLDDFDLESIPASDIFGDPSFGADPDTATP